MERSVRRGTGKSGRPWKKPMGFKFPIKTEGGGGRGGGNIDQPKPHGEVGAVVTTGGQEY